MKNSDALRKEQNDLKALAADINRADMSDDDQAEFDSIMDRAEALTPEIERAEKREARMASLADINRSVATVGNETAGKELTVGEYVASYFKAIDPMNPAAGGVGSHIDRASFYFNRAAAQQGTADNPSIIPEPIVGPVLDFLAPAERPVFSSFTSRPMPATGKTFLRPELTQVPLVDRQSAEFAELVSRKMTLTDHQVSKFTVGGQLDLSKQNIDWTDPSILGVAVQELLRAYAWDTEAEANDFLADLPTTTETYTGTNVTTITTSFINAIMKVKNQSGKVADTAWIDLSTWATLSYTYTANDRNVLSVIRESLSAVGAGGFNFVVTDNMDAATPSNPAPYIIVGRKDCVESYEQRHGVVQLDQPGNLSRKVVVSGYLAFWGDARGFTKLDA